MSSGRSWMFISVLALCQCQSDQRRAEKPILAADGGGGSAGNAGNAGSKGEDAAGRPTAQAGASGMPIADAGAIRDPAKPTPDAGHPIDARHPHDASAPPSDAALERDASQPNPDRDAARPSGTMLVIGVNAWGMRARSENGGDFIVCSHAKTNDDHSPDLLRDIGYGDGVFIAVGGDLNAMVMRSLDGVHWQEDLHPKQGCNDPAYPSSCDDWMGGVAYADGTWLAGGGNGALMRSRDAGLSWQGLHPMTTPDPIRHMAAGSGRFVAGADGGSVFVTPDAGDSWTRHDLWTGHAQAEGMRVAHGGDSFIAWGSFWNGSQTEQACFVSSDKGDHWSACAASIASSNSFVHDGMRWVTRAAAGYATSLDGVTWTMHSASGVPDELLFDGVTWFGRTGGSYARGANPDSFETIPNVTVPDFRSWTIGLVLDSNLPVSGVPACTNQGG